MIIFGAIICVSTIKLYKKEKKEREENARKQDQQQE